LTNGSFKNSRTIWRKCRSLCDQQTPAKGASLQRLLDLVIPQPEWQVLDIATATGHTAFAFAPHVAHVWATDITEQMLKIAGEGM
jgi:ubiquinone/menaquinone biosynthesis C-methylase UbiE